MVSCKKRRIAILLLTFILCFSSAANPFALSAARAQVHFPSGLTLLDDEAYYGDYKLEGIADLPGNVTELGTNIFCGTSLYAIIIPEKVSVIPAQGLNHVAYIRLEGKETQADPGAFSGVHYVFGPCQSASKGQAIADGAQFICTDSACSCTSKAVVNNGFYFLCENNRASLLCAQDGSSLIGAVTVPSALNNGTPVTALSSTAMMRCDGITQLQLPLGITRNPGCLDGAPNAVVSYYSDDSFYVTSIRSNQASVRLGSDVTWIARTNSTDAVAYYFEIVKQEETQETLVACSKEFRSSLLFEDSNRYTATLNEPGLYIGKVICRNANGEECTASSDPVVVQSPLLSFSGISSSILAGREGENITWTVSTNGGNGTVLYSYTLLYEGRAIDSIANTTQATYTLMDAMPGEYSMIVQIRDDLTELAAQRAAAVSIYTEEDACPKAPVLTAPVFSKVQETSSVMEANNMKLAWESVPYARQYGITVDLMGDGAWKEVHHARVNASKEEYEVSASLFIDLAEETLCRIGLYAVNLAEGEPQYYYVRLTPRVIDTSINIDGSGTVYWYEGYYGAASRSFVINSELPFTIQSVYGGDWYTYSVDGNVISVTYKENIYGGYLNERLRISNGVSSATLYLRHYCLTQAPELVYPQKGSIQAPSHLPMDPVYLEVADNECHFNMYIEKQKGDAWETVWSAERPTTMLFCARNAGLSANTLYRLRLVGYIRDLSETVQKDALVSYAYLMFDDAPARVSLGGDTEHTVLIPGNKNYNVDIEISGGVPSLSSDVDWLTASLSNRQDVLTVTPAENTTAASRTGHITITCGSACAVLTVVQQSNLPKLLQPATLSSSESSPTKVYLQEDLGENSFRAYCETLTLEVKENGEYVQVDTDSDDDVCLVTEGYDDAVTGTTYRLTLTRGSTTQYYYFTFAKGSYYIAVDNDDSRGYTLPAEGGKQDVVLKANGSWTAACSDSWLSVSSASGSSCTSGKTITITAQANNTGVVRKGTVTFKRGSYQQATAVITQYPIAQTLSLAWDLADVKGVTGGMAGKEYLYIDTVGDWTATISESWMGFNEACTKKTVSGNGLDEYTVYFAKNDSNGSPRTGTVTVTAGSVTKSIQITQFPAVDAVILSPDFSSDKETPTIFEHDDLVVTWKAAPYAAYYQLTSQVENFEGDTTKKEQIVLADGSSTYSATIPQDWMLADSGYVCRFTLKGVDANGNVASQIRYFQVVSGDGVFIDGKMKKSFSEANDLGDYDTFTITSTDTWTAAASHSWITLDKTSGVSEDKLTVTVAKNYGEERNGTVTVKCGDNSAVLQVNQCAYIPDTPFLADCELSLNMEAPAILPHDLTRLTVNWIEEDQPTYYNLRLYEVHSTDLPQFRYTSGKDATLIASALKLKPLAETYTFENLALNPGSLYMLDFNRTIAGDRTGKTHYYFMASTESTPYVYIYDDSLSEVEEYESGEDYGVYQITSNGTWRAQTDSDWLMVGDESYTWDELAEEGYSPTEFNVFTSKDDRLYVSLLANDSGKTRTGHVTLKIPGGKEAVITIVQPRSCTAATLISPALTDDKDAPVSLPYQNLTFRWKTSPDGAGKYTFTLRERLPGERSYYEIYEKTTTGSSVTIPVEEFTQNADYIVYLDTWVDQEYTVSKSYRFHMDFLNALYVTADVEWKEDSVNVTAYAGGGSGSGYEYSFALYCNGKLEDGTIWHDSLNKFTLQFSGAGTYQVWVYISDSMGQKKQFIVSEHIVGETAIERFISLTPSVWSVSADGGTTSIAVSANDNWVCTSNASWIHVAGENDSSVQQPITAAANATGAARVGTVTFTCGTATATLVVNQAAAAQADDGSRISLDLSDWTVSSDEASMAVLQVSATGSWAVVSAPAWITLSAANGNGNLALTMYASPNAGASREGTIDFICGSASASLAVQQMGNDTLPKVTAFSMDKTSVLTGVDVTFTVTAANADRVYLVVDDVQYEEYFLTDGSASFTRKFSSDGTRSVQLLPARGDTLGAVSAAKTLTVSSSGALSAPVLEEAKPVIIGSDAVIRWDPVPGAEQYTVYLSYGKQSIWKKVMEADKTECTIPSDVLVAEGSYTCVVLASATGYKQSENGMFIDVVTPRVDFRIAAPVASAVYVPKDTVDIQVYNPSGYNIAVKVTDEEGNITYLPENGGTVKDTFIQNQLLYSPLTTGKVTVQAMAWPTEMRTTDAAAWFDAKQNVTFTVNGPIARMIYLGNTSSASCLLTTDITRMSVKTNNAVTKVSVELDGKQISVTKDGQSLAFIGDWDSEVNYVRTFSCELPAATEGLHRYTVVAHDDAGRTHRRTYTLYVVTPATAAVQYAQTNIVLLRSTPAETAQNAVTLKYSTALSVIGTYTDAALGKLWYVSSSQGKGFVQAAAVGTVMHNEYEDVYFRTGYPTMGAADYNSSNRSLQYAWNSSLELPDGAVYRLYKRAKNATTWTLVFETTSNMPVFSTSTLGAGTWKIAVAMRVDGKDYGLTEFPYYTQIFSNEYDYLDYVDSLDNEGGDFEFNMKCVTTTYDSLVMAHEIFTVGCTINGKYYPPSDFQKMVDDGMFQFYYNVFGEGLPLESDMMTQMTVVSSVMESLAPKANDLGGKKAYDTVSEILKGLDFFEGQYNSILTAADKLFNKQNKKLSQFGEVLSIVNLQGIEEFSSAKEKVDIATDLLDAIVLAVRYSLVDDAELTKIAEGFLLCKSNQNMQSIGNMLLELRSTGNVAAYAFAMFEFDVAKFLKGAISDTIKGAISNLGWVGKLYMSVVDGALAFNDFVFNTSATQNAAVECSWWIQATDDYLPEFKNAMKEFKKNPLKNYSQFVLACETYMRLLEKEYSSFCDFCDVVNSGGWSWLKGVFSNKDEQMKASVERNRGFVNQLRSFMNINMEMLYEHSLADFGVPYDPVD